MPLRFALVEINPGRTRRIRRGKRRGGVITVKIDPKTKKVLKAHARGAKIPDYWIGVEWSKLAPLDRALGRAAREHRRCRTWAKRCKVGGKRCRKTFARKADFVRALEHVSSLEDYFEVLDPGAPQLRDFSDYAERRGRRQFKTWKEAARWLAPRSRRWEDVDPMHLAEFNEKLREALEAGGGGQTTLDKMGVDWRMGSTGGRSFVAVPPPEETERQLDKRRRARQCDEALELSTQDLLDELRAELAELVPF